MAATPSTNIIIPQGADFEKVFTSKETDGSISDLTGFTGVSKLKKHPTSVKSHTFTVGITSATGKVSIAMTSGETVKISPGRHNYDIFLTSPSGAVSKLVEGQVTVTAGITT